MSRQRIVAGVMLTLAALVCWPMLGGPVLLLDWVVAGKTPVLPRTVLGLDGGQVAGAPLVVAANLIGSVIGDAVTWLPFVLFFPIAGLGAARLAGGGSQGRIAAALLYVCNPFVFDRIAAGQVGVLAGMAVLPWAVQILVEARDRTMDHAIRIALMWALLIATGVHFAWIFGVVVLVASLVTRRFKAVLVGVALTGIASLYLVVAPLGQQLSVTVGRSDLAAYRTQGGGFFETLGNEVGLYGFWRRVPTLPKDINPVWPLLLVLVLAVVVLGIRAGDADPQRRPLARILAISGLAGIVLALGDQGPSGPLFRFVYDKLGFFQVMREPQKFLVLLALAYAVGFGWGVDALFARANEARGLAVAGLAIALPLLYTPSIINGLNHQARAVTIPASYSAAQKVIASEPGEVLVLPWHQYLAFRWTGTAIANPAFRLFGDRAISGDNVELSGIPTTSTSRRSAYIEGLLAARDKQTTFGRSVAPLGVRWVVLYKAVDYKRYVWLDSQSDLKVVLDTPDIKVYATSAETQQPFEANRPSRTHYVIHSDSDQQVNLAEPWSSGWSGAPVRESEQGTLLADVRAGTTELRFGHSRVAVLVELLDLALVLGLAGYCVIRGRTAADDD